MNLLQKVTQIFVDHNARRSSTDDSIASVIDLIAEARSEPRKVAPDDVVKFLQQSGSKADCLLIRRIAQQRIDGFNAAKREKTVVKRWSKWAYQMAELIWDNAQRVYPMAKEPDLTEWAVEIDKIERLDKVPQDVIRQVLVYTLEDKFWKYQVRSGGAFRRHFEQICVQAQAKWEAEAAKKGKTYSV